MQPRYIEAILALVLVLTLSLKIAVAPTVASEEISAGREAPVAAFLTRQGFSVGAPLPYISPPMLPARKQDCMLRVGEVSPYGWQQAVLAELATPGERLLFVFRGKVFSRQPTWSTYLDHLARRLLHQVGFNPLGRPVLGVLASAECAPQALPWEELAEIH